MKNQILEQYKDTSFNELQTQILDIVEQELETPDNRTVHWVYDEKGNAGKSYISKYLIAAKDTYYITGGKQQDILYAYNGQNVIIYDLARTYADNLDHIYTTIENFKNAMYLSTKYDSEMRIYNRSPVIIIMSNFTPDQTKLSSDRWNIISTVDTNALDIII